MSDRLKIALLMCALAGTAVCQEFTVPTPKGNLIVNVTSNRIVAGSLFMMRGTLTNTTAWDMDLLRLRVTFYDQNGNEFTSLCPREPEGAYCETLGTTAPAHRTVAFNINPGVVFSMGEMGYSGATPNIKGYSLSFRDAFYNIQYRFTMLKPTASDDMTFEDESLGFRFSIDPEGLACTLRNKTFDPISINWNQVSYVDSSGDAHKVIHSGVRLVDKESPQTPTLIPPTARINETIFPADYIVSGSRGLSQNPLWPHTRELSKDQSYLKRLEGSTFSVFMPIEVGGKTKNYSFVFKIVSVEY